ncbi:MAG: hypothetical protein HC828_14770 [Blastochloris sp.]|nr:hypothetical protein [Blastochloris sp.]
MHRLILACGLLLIVISASAAHAQTTLLQVQVFDTRADLEVLADEFLGTGNRPTSWVGNIDVNSPSLVTDLWFDNEQLADLIFGPGQRPPDWIGATVPTADILARNVRHDLELSADEFFGLNQRPELWRGTQQIIRCERELQNIVTVLRTFYAIESTLPESTLNYCPTLLADLEDELYDITFNEPNLEGETRDPIALLSAVRGDIERVADELLGLNTRRRGGSATATRPRPR